jgi:CitMHS family citrate-Mg2+:H+ or citrate-Ca2+:H+ symporter
MLAWLGLATIVVLLALILFRITSVLVALTLVPLAAALAGGFGPAIGAFAMDGIRNVTPTAALLAFAVIYFGVMNDVGLFEPVIGRIVRLVGHDPLKIVIGTAVIASVAHLDGAGASTFMITVPAMLPLYRRLGMDPLILTCTTAMAAGTMNILPWGGPTSRAAASLQVGPGALFMPLAVPTAAGMAAVFVLAAVIGRGERRRLRMVPSESARFESARSQDRAPHRSAWSEDQAPQELARPEEGGPQRTARSEDRAPHRSAWSEDQTPQELARHEEGGPQRTARSEDQAPQELARPEDQVRQRPVASPGMAAGPRQRRLWLFNAALTAMTLVALVVEVLPLAVVFLVACAVALVVNYPDAREQRERMTAHGSAAMVMVTVVLAAGMFTGIMTQTGMLTAMATAAVSTLPESALAHLPLLVGLASMPLSLAFDPDSFYFGVLPVLAAAADAAGASPIEVGRAALLGQMTTGFPVSPLTPATFLLVGLADVDLADHQRRAIPYLFVISLVMTAVALVTGAVHW